MSRLLSSTQRQGRRASFLSVPEWSAMGDLLAADPPAARSPVPEAEPATATCARLPAAAARCPARDLDWDSPNGLAHAHAESRT
jgi:hypothetical protein